MFGASACRYLQPTGVRIFGTSQFTDEVTFSNTNQPGHFPKNVTFKRHLIGRELDHFQKP